MECDVIEVIFDRLDADFFGEDPLEYDLEELDWELINDL